MKIYSATAGINLDTDPRVLKPAIRTSRSIPDARTTAAAAATCGAANAFIAPKACKAAIRTVALSCSSRAAAYGAAHSQRCPSAATDARRTAPLTSSKRAAMMAATCCEVSIPTCANLKLAAMELVRTRLVLCSTPRITTASGPVSGVERL